MPSDLAHCFSFVTPLERFGPAFPGKPGQFAVRIGISSDAGFPGIDGVPAPVLAFVSEPRDGAVLLNRGLDIR